MYEICTGIKDIRQCKEDMINLGESYRGPEESGLRSEDKLKNVEAVLLMAIEENVCFLNCKNETWESKP